MATYLEIVNDAIAETKASLDPLTSVNFDTPPRTVLYNHFKRWANMAYTELYMKRPEWEFRKERYVLEIWPRLQLSGLTYIPLPGDVYTCASSGVIFTIKEVHTYEDIENDSIEERTVSVDFDDTSNPTNLILMETVDTASGTGYLKGIGRYNFKSTVIDGLDPHNVCISYPPSDADELGNEVYQLEYIASSAWNPSYIEFPWTSAYDRPTYITETHDGNFELFPHPARNYILSFEFSRQVSKMVVWDDVPTNLPTRYHDYIMWRTVQEYADWNKDNALFMRAKKHVDEYLFWLDRDSTQKPTVVGCLFRV